MTIPPKRLVILSVDDGLEGVAIRSVAERFGIAVAWYGVGMASDLVELLNQPNRPDLILLCCHGDQGRILIPELGETCALGQPFTGQMTAGHVRTLLQLEGKKILSTGCMTGAPDMAEAFLQAGCAFYIAPEDYPDGSAATLFAVSFIYHHLCRGLDARAAWLASRQEDDDSRFFALYASANQRTMT